MIADARERAREAVRREVADAAFDLFVERGYDVVTVEEIVRAVGISRATFFRYFETKEDIVVETASPREIDFAQAVAEFGEAGHVRPFQAVRRVLFETLPDAAQQTDRLRARVIMATTYPALGARLAVRRGARQADLIDALLAQGVEPIQARLSATIGFACLDVAWKEWAMNEHALDLRQHYECVLGGATKLFSAGP